MNNNINNDYINSSIDSNSNKSYFDNFTSYFKNYHKRLFFLYGKTSDEFCLLPWGLSRIEELLHRHLFNLGYRRIIFFNGKYKLYCYDHQTKRLLKPDSDKENDKRSKKVSKKSKICAGPLGMRKIRQNNKENTKNNNKKETDNSQNNTSEESLCYGQTNDMEMVGVMDHCMRDYKIKTALIFTDGLDFINHIDQEAIRQMGGNLNQWCKEPSENENICIFILPEINVDDIQNSLSHRPQWLLLKSKMFKKNSQPKKELIIIGSPQKDEVKNLMHYYRLKKNMKVDWSAFNDAVVPITRNIITENLSLKELSTRLKKLDNLKKENLDMLARQNEKIPALERLSKMKGLGSVAKKMQQFVAFQQEKEKDNKDKKIFNEKKIDSCQRILPEIKKPKKELNLHMVLTGNPGTGKTMSASLIAEILFEAGLLELGHFVKASREDIVAGYVGQTALQTSKKISQAIGGVLFIDEAYRLTQGGDNDFGKEAIETIMEAMSNHMGEFSVIVAGYPAEIENFLNSNPGLKRRFGNQNIIHFPNYEPDDLRHIFEQKVKQMGKKLDHNLERLLPDFISNWHAAQDPQTFGNAGDVINLFEAMELNRSNRVTQMEVEKELRNTITADDIPEKFKEFFKPAKAANIEEVLKNLDNLTGLTNVKEWLCQLTDRMKLIQEQKRRNINSQPPACGHYIFIGRPGTGKTTVARMMGRIFQLLKLLGKSEVLVTGPGDLIDKYVGGTEDKTKKVFQKAINGVLFIDEAHQLAESGSHSYGRIVVKELVPFMENNKEKCCVIVAGYPEEIKAFLEIDPGLKSRFTETIVFEDFSENELASIFFHQLEQNNEIAGPGLKDSIRQVFQHWILEKDKNFGNARDVHKLLEKMRRKLSNRLAKNDFKSLSNEDLKTFLPCDIPDEDYQKTTREHESLNDILLEMNQLIGLSNVKNMIKTIMNHIKIEQMRGSGSAIFAGHYSFVGNPGTGKTTVARMMGKMFKALGILKKGHLVETGRSDLVAGYMGQSALKTKEVLERSLDGVLFIDEAYQLVNERDSFGKEALETLVAFMENHRDRLCIIAAGYPEPMRKFIQENPGLPSRFTSEIIFENFSAAEMLDIFKLMAEKHNMILEAGMSKHLIRLFEKISINEGAYFGNAREVRKILDSMIAAQANRLAETYSDENPIQKDSEKLYRLEIQDLPSFE